MHTQVGIIMGSRLQWTTMQHTAKLLAHLGIAYEARIITANKNINRLHEYAGNAIDRGLEIIIAGSAGAAYLPGILASKTEIPVLGVPMTTNSAKHKKSYDFDPRNYIDNQVSMLTTGPGGAVNAALFAASMLANKYPRIRENLMKYRSQNECGDTAQENSRYTA
ncbi:5-(carboxyamino)imidazole ribonucleotide mutase [Sulfuriflexus mobilis]|uniref:5-(carboxyamino)imidazole ribonucleotide mutase n=1 Tax=Sulfuriflexus mobilis TaxID=1811807 RepID=UPI000F83FD45|nr:AIR carboxylase family protein [Sulfuriflexus mobilis]